MTSAGTVMFSSDPNGIRTIVLNRPHRRNAFNDAMLAELAATVERVNADVEAKVLVLKGSRTAFCAGRDLSELAEVSRRDAAMLVPPPGGHESAMFRAVEVPTIAVAEGPVVGGGLGFFLQCDVKVATDDALLIDGHLRNGMTSSVPLFYLPRVTTTANALEVLCSPEGVRGDRAAEMGIVDVSVPADRIDATVDRLTAMLVQWDGQLLRHTIRLLRTAREGDYATTMAAVGLLRALRRHTSEVGPTNG